MWPRRRDVAVQHPHSLSMHSLNRDGWLRRSTRVALLLGALPLSLVAQVRRPDPAPVGPRAAGKAPRQRTEILVGGGTVSLNTANATKSTMPVASLGFRRQISPEWLFLGASVDLGRSAIDGTFFPYEKRAIGDTIQYLVVDGSAMMFAGRVSADVLWPIDEAEKYRAGVGGNGGVYAMFPSGAGSSFVAPTFGASFVGEADLTSRIGVAANLGFTQFTNFDREKLRPSDPALADPVFRTPLITPPDGVKSFGGARLIISLTYRLGVKKTTGGKK